MKYYLALSSDKVAEAKNSNRISWSLFEKDWPDHYDKKWIPLAPSYEEALRRFHEILHEEPGAVLAVELPPAMWEEGVIVPNPGSRREGDSYTNTDGHFLYGRVHRTDADPVLYYLDYDNEWVIPP